VAPTLPPTAAPTPAPTPAPTSPPSQSDLAAAIMDGNQALAEELLAGMQSSPLLTFGNLLLQEQQRQQEERNLGQVNLVDDNQCRR
jgi:hypothetical protein